MIATDATRSGRLLTVTLVLALLPVGSAQAAPSGPERAEAEALFQEGKKLMLQKRPAEACPKFEASQRLDPAGGTLLNIALCHEDEGKLASAWAEFQEALTQARNEKKAERVRIAREHIERLEPRLPRLLVQAPAGPVVAGLVVTRNGVAFSEASLGTPLPLDPGDYALEATAPRHRPWRQRVTVTPGETKKVSVTLEREPEPVASAPPPEPPPPPSSRATVAYIVGGLGLVSLGVGTVFGLRTFSQKSRSDDECPGGQCTARGAELSDQAHTSASIANLTVGLGLVGVGVGAFLLLTAPSVPAPQASRWQLSPVVGAQHGGLRLGGSF